MPSSDRALNFSFDTVKQLCHSRDYSSRLKSLISKGVVPIVVSKNSFHDLSLCDFSISGATNYLLLDYHLDANSNEFSSNSFVKFALINGRMKKDNFFAFGLGELFARDMQKAKKGTRMSDWSRTTLALFNKSHLFTYEDARRFRKTIPSLGSYLLSIDLDVLWKFKSLDSFLEHLLSHEVPSFIEVFSDTDTIDQANVMHMIRGKLSVLDVPYRVVFLEIKRSTSP